MRTVFVHYSYLAISFICFNACLPACLLLLHRLLPRIANIRLLHLTFFPSISLLSLLHSFQQLLNAGLFIIASPLLASTSVPELLLLLLTGGLTSGICAAFSEQL